MQEIYHVGYNSPMPELFPSLWSIVVMLLRWKSISVMAVQVVIIVHKWVTELVH